MRIDAHQHFWRLERGDYGWLTPPSGPIFRDFLPVDLEPILARHPDLPVVLDHGAKPHLREATRDSSRLDPWRADITAVAARPATDCKLSGPMIEAAPGWTIDDLPRAVALEKRLAGRRAGTRL